jgi:hypothetical protein
MHARIAMLQAIHHNEAPVFNPDRKDPHWAEPAVGQHRAEATHSFKGLPGTRAPQTKWFQRGRARRTKAGRLEAAISRAWLVLHESGTYVKFTPAGAELFA